MVYSHAAVSDPHCGLIEDLNMVPCVYFPLYWRDQCLLTGTVWIYFPSRHWGDVVSCHKLVVHADFIYFFVFLLAQEELVSPKTNSPLCGLENLISCCCWILGKVAESMRLSPLWFQPGTTEAHCFVQMTSVYWVNGKAKCVFMSKSLFTASRVAPIKARVWGKLKASHRQWKQ